MATIVSSAAAGRGTRGGPMSGASDTSGIGTSFADTSAARPLTERTLLAGVRSRRTTYAVGTATATAPTRARTVRTVDMLSGASSVNVALFPDTHCTSRL